MTLIDVNDMVPAARRDWRAETAAYCGPRAGASQEMWDFARSALGFTVLLPPTRYGGGYLEQNMRNQYVSLDKAAAAGVQLLLWEPRLLEDVTVLDRYRPHPALAGFVLPDEPHADVFHQLAIVKCVMAERRPELLAYVNLPASWTDTSLLGTESYEQYLDLVKTEIDPDVWSFDDYGSGQGHDLEDALRTADLVKARAGDKPVWGYVATVTFDQRPVPSFEDKCRWAQAFLDRGVTPAWFTYYCPPGGDGIDWQGGYARY